ncbi:conserved hypothetical protein [Methanocella paludicola SANAE]|uniref:Carboxypeptidase regulatory-like domain-containing protein n=2 Tax=Methanocella TaxID=570266 RepID=D1Z252_METPS|nr:conserved hypothetical protein [Methanocella paludicola SANAE]
MLMSEKKRSMGVGGINVHKFYKTATILLLLIVISLPCMGSASAAGHDNSTDNQSITPTPGISVTPTPVPTPAPRKVFNTATAGWSVDHESITVSNTGKPITIIAWIEERSQSVTISVGANESLTVSTPSIEAQNGQVVTFGFEAYENGTLIDSYTKTIAVITSPTPSALPPESASIAGVVVDESTGKAVSGATITFRSVSYEKTYPPVKTGSDGSFTSPKMYPDVYTMTISASGYQPASLTTNGKITGDATVAAIGIKSISVATTTPTPTPTVNPIDSWVSLMYNPALCVGTVSSLIAVIAGSIGIYEWMERKRREREGLSGQKKDDGPKPPKI